MTQASKRLPRRFLNINSFPALSSARESVKKKAGKFVYYVFGKILKVFHDLYVADRGGPGSLTVEVTQLN